MGEGKAVKVREFRQFVWDSALSYLAVRADMNVVREHMSASEVARPEKLSQVYLRLLESLSNRQGMQNTIGEIQTLEPVFYGFDHVATLQRYSDGWESLFDAIRTKIRPPSRMDRSNSRSYWVIFCKGSISGAEYLARFSTTNEFLQFVSDFDDRVSTRPALPLMISEEIFGFGFALACDFLKELGFSNYSKPDTHLTGIFTGLGLSQNTQLDVFRAVALLSDEVGETPYAVDKAFWLIGSGNLYLQAMKFETSKREFADKTMERWKVRNARG